MLYIIGGAPRTGKTIIAQEFLEQANIPFLSVDVKPSDKLSIIRSHPGPEDWLSEFDDDEVLYMIDEMIEFSRQLRIGSQELGLPYFENSGEFRAFKERVIAYLQTGRLPIDAA